MAEPGPHGQHVVVLGPLLVRPPQLWAVLWLGSLARVLDLLQAAVAAAVQINTDL